MSRNFQVAIDCADPHLLNRFWAEAMGYQREWNDERIEQLMEAGYITEDDITDVDGHKAFKTAAACNDPEGRLPRLLFQQVPEGKVVKNRVHLDLRFGTEGREPEIERLISLGARKLWDGQQGTHTWVTMADPEGNEFCLS